METTYTDLKKGQRVWASINKLPRRATVQEVFGPEKVLVKLDTTGQLHKIAPADVWPIMDSGEAGASLLAVQRASSNAARHHFQRAADIAREGRERAVVPGQKSKR